MKKNYFLDWLLFICIVICAVTGLIIDFHWFSGGREVKVMLTTWHKYAGYLMAVGMIFHLSWHMGWVRNVTKLLFKDSTEIKK